VRSVTNLEEPIIAYDLKVPSLHPVGHPDHFASLDNLGVAVDIRYRHSGTTTSIKGLKTIVTHFREALGLRPERHPSHPDFAIFNNHAIALHTRYKQLSSMNDLDAAIAYNRRALRLYDDPGHSHPDRSMSLNNLANAYLSLFKRSRRSW
jgi:tetratricopeptide (TPR) repeat protein